MNNTSKTAGVVIVGSGFAAYQLVKMLRKKSADLPVTVVTAGDGDEYTKPDLSHVFTRKQRASDLVKVSGIEFAEAQNIRLLNHTRIDSISPEKKQIVAGGEVLSYDKLVLATGATPWIPEMKGDALGEIVTLNSLDEYRVAEEKLAVAKRVMVIGAGLVGTEIAMDLASSGREVILSDRAEQLMPRMLPEFMSARLFQTLAAQGCQMALNSTVVSLDRNGSKLEVVLNNSTRYQVDSVISAVGLRPATGLAEQAGLKVNRGIVVNRSLQTSNPDIYALGDCAEIEGRILPFLQPIMLSAGTLSKALLGEQANLILPAMLTKIKTPLLPMQCSGVTAERELSWTVESNDQGMVAQAFAPDQKLVGFITTENRVSESFPLLRQLPQMI